MSQKSRITKRKLGSFPFISVIFSFFLSLVVLGMIGILLMFAKNITKYIRDNVEMQVFLHKHITENERTIIQKNLSELIYIQQNNGEALIELVTKEQAAKQFIDQTGEDFTKILSDNPLHDLFIIKIKPQYHSSQQMDQIKKEISAIRGVFEVSYVENVVKSIHENITKLSLIMFFIGSVLLATVVVLIHNTLKIALYSQRMLIRSMQLVGATASFIRRPFLIRSVIFGMLAASLASFAILGILYSANQVLTGLNFLQDTQSILILVITLFGIGTIVSYLSTFVAVKKYLNMSLDELY